MKETKEQSHLMQLVFIIK